MVLFRGTFDHTLDAKNRLTMPAQVPGGAGRGVILAVPFDLKPCIGVWRPEDYEHYTSARSRNCHSFHRACQSSSASSTATPDAELDAAGRIMVPPSLGEHAGLGKEVVIVGVGNRLELWDRERWAEHRPALFKGSPR